jgi:hypothetical protein
MRYTVLWLPSAEAALTNLWLRASDQQAIADAANRLDRALAIDPDAKGHRLGNSLFAKRHHLPFFTT